MISKTRYSMHGIFPHDPRKDRFLQQKNYGRSSCQPRPLMAHKLHHTWNFKVSVTFHFSATLHETTVYKKRISQLLQPTTYHITEHLTNMIAPLPFFHLSFLSKSTHSIASTEKVTERRKQSKLRYQNTTALKRHQALLETYIHATNTSSIVKVVTGFFSLWDNLSEKITLSFF